MFSGSPSGMQYLRAVSAVLDHGGSVGIGRPFAGLRAEPGSLGEGWQGYPGLACPLGLLDLDARSQLEATLGARLRSERYIRR